MARLIPRKQIEEQQNISGSLNIRQDVNIGNNAIISGSLFVSQSFFLGSTTGSKSEITGSVFLTGSLTIDGLFQTTNPSAIFSVTSSNTLVSLDTQRYEGIRARDFGANVPTLYVSSTDGNDANDGRSIQFPLRTIKRASQLATPGYDGRYGLSSSSLYNGYVIRVQAGTYLEDNPVILPKNSTIWGSGLRITKILAANKDEDLFWVNSGCYVAEVTVGGLRLYPDQINPTKGFGFAFQPGAFITTSPYIQNCSQISNQENSFAELYEEIPPGGGGLYVNGDVINPDSPLASMVLDAYTQISPNGVGCLVNGRGFIQLVSFFNNFSYYAIRVNNGGHATLNNSNISFGLYGMYASGSRLISGSGGDLDSRNSVRSTWSSIVDVLAKGYPDGLPTASILNTNAGIKVTSQSQFFLAADQTASLSDIDSINSNFSLVSEIITNGNSEFPTLLAKSSNKGYNATSPYNILGDLQITSSIGASNTELNQISSSFGTLLGIFANGTGSYVYKPNTIDGIKVTDISPITSAIPATNYITSSVSSSFETIINIVKNGLVSIPKVVSNASSSILVSDEIQFTTGESSSLATVNLVSSSFSIVYNIIANGTGSSILNIPENEQVEFIVENVNSSSFNFDGFGTNPTLTLFRGNTYKFHVNAKDTKGPLNYPFWIRTKPVSGIEDTYDYNIGVVNNGDSVGNITFTVPYNAPNTLYYVAENSDSMIGVFNIVNATSTPIDLIQSTLTYPKLVQSSSLPSENVDKINAYDQLINNIPLIQAETIAFASSSWSSVYYNQATCSRDVEYIVRGVAKDLLYGGNEESIRSGIYYYLYPSQATVGAEKTATLAAVKYATELSLNLIKNVTLQNPNSERESVAQCIVDNRDFVQTETIAYLSSSWSGGDGFVYNEAKCKRDVGYILDAVATDLKYGGNERSIEAARYYYLYPSPATVAGIPSSAKQLEPTLNGVRYAAGVVLNLIQNNQFSLPTSASQATADLLRANKELIQNETIQYIGVAYPQLTYNTAKCRRDVGYIIDAVATDLLYGGNERSVTAGKNYYNYPSIATSIQKKETSGAIRYTKIISDYVVQNIVLDTPRIVNNDEKGIKVTAYNNVTSSINGTQTEYSLISSSFGIAEGIIKKGLESIPAVLAKNTNQNWTINNPLNVTTNVQTTSSYVTPNEINTIDRNFGIVTNIIDNGISVEPVLTSSLVSLIKVTDIEQVSATAATNNETASISSSFAYVMNVISGGLGQLNSLVSNLSASIVVTNTSFVSSTAATGSVGTLISSSMSTIATIISGGLGVVPKLTSSLANNIKVTNTSQYISASYSGSLEDVSFVSSSIAIVTNIIKGGSSPAKGLHTSSLSTANAKAAYQLLKQNIPFIQAETIAYLSSSWAGFDYDEVKCKRDVGLIISGAAEDLIFNSNSASIVNGEYYYEFPSQATDSQLNQTLDGINYASRLAQKLIQNIPFTASAYNNQNADTLLKNNKVFIQNETIAYMSSSWGSFDYNEAKCRRDVGYIIDAVRTDIVYGGNERTIEAGRYYFLYPSEATDTQLQQTTDAINYASRLAQKVVANTTFVTASVNKVNASNLLSLNKSLIAAEVVEYVSSSWSGVQYNEEKCKRDVGYILDAVITDLVYGGNERTTIAGQYYYLFPSAATVGGEPTATQQLDPTITGVNYARRLAQNIVLNKTLVSPSQAVLDARELVKANTTFIQQNTIEYISDTYPNLDYKVDKCYRDVRFIVDGVLTDLVYGGNERSRQSGEFYYKYPSQATDSQANETIDAINFAKELTKLIAIGGKAIEDGFDTVVNIISSGSVGYPNLVSNTLAGIGATTEEQYIAKKDVISSDKTIVSSSFGNVINIIDKGVGVIPTIVSSTNKGVGRISGTQITSSISVDQSDKNLLGSSFDIILDIVENGTGSIPTIVTNAIGTTKVTPFTSTTGTTISSSLISSTTSSFNIVLDIIENGTGSMASLVTNANSLVKVTGGTQYTTGNDASSKAGLVTSSFDTILDIIENGTSVIPTLIENTTANIRFGGAPTSGTPATSTEANTIGTLFDIVTGIVENGTGSMATLIPYITPSSNTNVLNAYANLKANITFIQNETIAYLSSSWSTASYNETKCKRDVGLIVSGAAEDLLFNANSASLMNGKFYYLYPSQAETTQLNQTLDGINYAKRLAKKIVVNTTFVPASNESYYAKDLLINNKTLIANEVVAYISSSWTIGDNTSDPYFYNETTCKRDVGYILDAVATDIFYGGNERSSKAGEFYYLYPSQATGYQLDQTLDGVRYAKNIAEKIVKGNTLVSVSQQKLDARTIIDNNRTFIAEEVVAYVSSSWRDFDYNESKCKRDVGYILDAVKTDLVYGGNERSRQAGEYYYRYPSTATGAQLAPTLTGVKYAKGLVLEVLANNAFQTASLSKQTAYDLLVDNKLWIQNQTIAKINANLDTITYNEATCKRDVGYIVDAVATDILYGGNERSAEAGEFYYLYPSAATGSQLAQTLEGIGYAKSLSNSVIANELVYTQSTSSITPITTDINKVGTGFDIVLDIIANGTGSIPTIVTNVNSLIKRTTTNSYITTASIASTYLTSSNNSFDIVLDIVENGTGSIPVLVKNTDSLVKITNTNQYTSSVIISSSLIRGISGSFDKIINILEHGTGSKPTTATYNPTNGDFVITIPNHNYKASDSIYLKPESFVFTCIMDGNRTEHALPSIGQRAYNSRLSIISVTTNTITVNVGASGPDVQFTPTNATYDPSTGNFVMTVGAHSLSIGEGILITTGSMAFTCNMDSNQSTKSYPRFGIDPYAGRSMKITNTTATTLTVNVGASAADKYFTPSAVSYNALTGDMVVTVGQHGLGVGRSIVLASASIAFTCDQNGNATTHSYPRSGSDPYAGKSIQISSVGFSSHTITNAPYTSSTGIVTLTVAGHGFSNGDYVKIADNSLTYTCVLDDNTISKSYPRAGYDYPSGRWLAISNVTTNTFTINIGASSYIGAHTFVSAVANSLARQTGTFTINVGNAGSASGSIHTFVSASANAIKHLPQSIHTFVSASANAIKHLPQSVHTFIRADKNAVTPIPTVITPNTNNNIKVTDATQYFGVSAATQTEANAISASISIVTNIIANGTGSLPTVTLYTSSISSSNVIAAYTILKSNLDFIVSESIAYLSSSWSTASYNEDKCRRDLGFILSGSAEDLIWNANSASLFNGKFYYQFPSQAQGAQLNQTLDGIKYASRLAQKLVLNTLFVTQSAQVKDAYTILVNNKELIKNEVIPYISSSWSTHQYIESTCKRDVGHIIDAVSTDLLYGGNERSVNAGVFYYLYPSDATGSQIQETVTGIGYARDISLKLLKGNIFTKVSQNKLQAKELIYNNREFIQNEVISYISASWSTASYNQTTCKRDVGHILDAVTTDIVYGGNERSINAGKFYYEYPSQATTSQLGPTLSGIQHAKGVTQQILKNSLFVTASNSAQTAYELLVDNKDLIQTETIGFLNSAWSFFDYNEAKCRRDVGYIVDAVATDILYGGNEASARAGEYYYLYPSLATVEGDGNESGQLDQTLDGVKYAKGIAQKIVANTLLKKPTISEKTGFDLLINNKQLIQKETIAYISSSWSGVGSFSYNEASCSRDVAYILDNVATDLIYGGNERSSKAGEYYYLYPSKATVISSISPDTNSQKGPTIDGVAFAAGLSQTILNNTELIQPTDYVKSAVSLLKQNRTFIQNETIQYIDAFFPYLTYLREKCRRDVGYIVDGVATDLFYGGNQRSITSGDYYFRYPNKATTSAQLSETVSGIEYAKAVSKKVAQNIILTKPEVKDNTSANIKATNTNQYTSSINVSTTEISKISSSFSIVTDIIKGGVQVSPTKVLNTNAAIKVSGLTPTTSSINGGSTYADLVTSSFNLVRDIINYGEAGIPDALARNYDYGFQLATPTLLHISSTNQTSGGSVSYTSYTSSISSSFANVINIVNNGISSIPAIIDNTSGSIKVQSVTSPIAPSTNGGTYEKNTIGNLYGIVTKIIETQTYPTFVSNTSASIKVTNTPQLISGSGAQRLQSKLVSSSFAVVSNIILNGTGSQTYVAPSATANSNPKITSAYNLLLGNKNMIIDETIAYMSSSWSTFDYNETKCRRDLGYIIDGAASDLLYGGNSGSFLNGQFYSLIPSLATSSQLDQTLTAIRYASGISEKVVQNTTLQHISASLTTSASYVALRANKQFIQSESIAYVSSSWSEFSYNETTCKRDIGYIIDAVSTDLLYGGNERSWIAGDYYYRYPSNATTSELQPTLDGVIYAKGISMGLVTGSSYSLPAANVSTIYTLLKNNKEFVQNEVVAFVNAKYPYLYYDQTKCKRDIGYIVDAVITDFKYGGNLRSSKAGEFYYKYPSLATESEQVVETTAAIDYARRMMQTIIVGNTISTPQIVSNTFNNIKVTNTPQISGVAATQTEVTAISSSIGIVTNIVSNGTGSLPTIIPYTIASTNPNVINAYNNLKNNLSFIAAETVAYISSSWVTGSNSDLAFTYNDLSCSRDVKLIISGAAEDLLFNANSASVMNGKFYYLYPSQATTSQLDETLDGIGYASQLAQKIVLNTLFVTASATASAVYTALKNNKPFIQAETIAFVSSSWSGLAYTESKCRRDVGLIIDAVATDILYGGNQRSATAGQYYFKYPSQATGSQLDSTLNAIDYAGGTAKNVITNTTFVTASQSVSASVELLRNNRLFIQNETMAYLTASWSSFEYNKDKCKRDIGYIIDGVATDILYGGNERSVMSGDFYYKYPSKATLLGDGDGVGQLGQTLDGIIYASRVAQKVAQNTQFVTASSAVSASFDLLRKNKNFIAAETIAYVSSSWSTVYYNEASCSRDVNYLIDAAATDLYYGGQERSVTAGSYYFLFPSKATKAGVPSEANQLDPTITGVRYAGRLASKVVLNPTFQYPSQSAVYGKQLLAGNRTFLQKETIAFLSSSWSTLQYNEASCSRDVGFIVDAVSTDLIYGGNERSIQAGSYYYLIPSVAIQPSYTDNGKVGQRIQTADGVNYAKGVAGKVVIQTQLIYPTVKKRAAANRLLASKETLKYSAIAYTNGAFPYLSYNEASCSRDTGLIVDACVTDLLYGGNERGIAAASSYYTGQYGTAIAVTRDQLLETLETNRYLRTRAEFIAANAPLESFGSLIVATGIDYSYNGSGVTFKALPPNQGGNGKANPDYYITELGGGRIYFTSGDQDGNFSIGTGLTINQATGTLVGRTFNKSLFALVTPYSLALQI